jgi:uncharacterized protein YndB with AHSA1/START domain
MPPTTMSKKVTVTPKGDREIEIARSFNAPRQLVFDAFSRPEMMKQWFHGPPGWTLVTCTIDLRVGGTYRWEWRNENGNTMGMGGKYLEVVPPERIVSTEKFDDPWYPGEAVGTIVLSEAGGVTRMALTVQYASAEAREAVLRSPMESGLESGYARLDDYLASQA